MIINHNMGAMNAQRNMGINSNNASKSMEKLSSGLRINRAGDDAAGLSISEKMRAQIRGLDQASTNAQDGISMIQTAEGALNETHSILQRMRELSVQASNDTNILEDRSAIQAELTQLTDELDRIAETTEFNKQNLLNGDFSGKLQIGANAGQDLSISINGMSSSHLALNQGVTLKTETLDDQKADIIADGKYTIVDDGVADELSVKNLEGKVIGTIDTNNASEITLNNGETITIGSDLAKGDSIVVSTRPAASNATDKTIVDMDVTVTKAVSEGEKNDVLGAGEYTVNNDTLMKGDVKVGIIDGTDLKDDNGNVILDLSATFGLTAGDITAGFKVQGLDVSSSATAQGSITAIDKALTSVSEERSKLGAYQNRLEHTINNLGTSSENLTAAESRIRDTDMASEMSEYSKNNILQQAAQAMLAQAKSAPQSVLQLLN